MKDTEVSKEKLTYFDKNKNMANLLKLKNI